MSQRNYADTGTRDPEQGGQIYCYPNKGEWVVSKDRQGRQLIGYLDAATVVFKDGNAEKKVAPHWALVLKMSVADPVRGTDDGSGTKVAQYNVEIPSLSRRYSESVINTILGTDKLTWDGYLRMTLWQEDGAAENQFKMAVHTNRDHGKGNYAPVKFPYDAEIRGLRGVARAIFIDKDASGRDIYNHRPSDNFWLVWAKELCRIVNGKDEAFNFFCVEDKKVYIPGEYYGSPELEATIRAEQGLSASAPAPTAPKTTEVTEAQFNLAVENRIGSMTSIGDANSLLELASKNRPSTVSISMVVAKVQSKLDSLFIQATFNQATQKFEAGSSMSFPQGAQGDQAPAIGDDFPF